MKKVFDDIIETIKNCEANCCMFNLPNIGNHEFVKKEHEAKGSILFSISYIIGNETENINIDYESRDKCRTFQVEPDLNIISVVWMKNGLVVDKLHSSWDDKF